jgi:hypothetical protein
VYNYWEDPIVSTPRGVVVDSVNAQPAADAVDLETADFVTDTKLVSDPYP